MLFYFFEADTASLPRISLHAEAYPRVSLDARLIWHEGTYAEIARLPFGVSEGEGFNSRSAAGWTSLSGSMYGAEGSFLYPAGVESLNDCA
jgi:hypothetical protein